MMGERELNAHAMGVARLPDAERVAEIRRLTEAGKAGTLTRIRGALRDLNRETPNDERAAALQQVEAAMQRLKHKREGEARQAVVKRDARKAGKEQTAMTTMEKSKWTPDDARNATAKAFDDGYRPVTIIPHTLKDDDKFKDAGKLPGAFYVESRKWGKLPGWAAYAERAKLADQLDWYGQTPSAPNVGILCGVKTERGYLVGVDIDCDAPEVLEGLAKLCNGEMAVRVGRADRSGLVPLLVDSLDAAEVFACGGDRIQLLKAGKQFVARGIHPQRRQPYRWASFDTALGEAVGDGEMPSVAQLPLVKLVDVLAVFEAAGFRAGDVTKSENASAVKADLLSNLENAEDDGDDFEVLFGDNGKFPLSELAEENRAFAKNLASWGEDYEPDSEDISHYNRRVGFYSDIVRQWPEFTIAHAKVLHLSERLPGLGRFTGLKEGDGSITDKHIANAFEYAKRKIAAELRGEVKQHDSTKAPSTGAAFGEVDDEDESGKTERQATKAEMVDKAEKPTNVVYLEAIRSSPPRFLEWSVKHFIARGTTAVVSGQWGAGKTAVYMDIALHIAAGLDWHGKKVKQGVVVYCGLENPEDIARRVRAWGDMMEDEGHDLSGCAFVQHKGPISLVKADGNIRPTKDETALIKTANDAAEYFGMDVAMIIVDTVSASISPGNDREHAGLYMKAMERISQATGAHVTALHHPTKTGDPLRGGGEFFGNGDAVILVSRDEKTKVGTIKASLEKFRIGDPALVDFNYELKPHKIGVDEDGEAINVILAVEHRRAEAMGAVSDDEADARLERFQLLKYENLEDYVLDYMRQQVAGAGDEVTERTTFLSDELREAVTPALDHFAPHTRKSAKGEKLTEQRRKQFARLLAGLVDQKRVTVQRAQGRQSVVRLLESYDR
jgi:hypothetical protein